MYKKCFCMYKKWLFVFKNYFLARKTTVFIKNTLFLTWKIIRCLAFFDVLSCFWAFFEGKKCVFFTSFFWDCSKLFFSCYYFFSNQKNEEKCIKNSLKNTKNRQNHVEKKTILSRAKVGREVGLLVGT